MFDLDQEVAAWTAAAFASRCRREASIAELTDHLYCELARGRAEGLDDKQAFHAAITRLGSPREFAAEEAKNNSVFQKGCAIALRWERSIPGSERRGLMLVNALLWAAVMIASATLWKRGGGPPTIGWVLLTVLTSGWWASEAVLRRAVTKSRKANPS